MQARTSQKGGGVSDIRIHMAGSFSRHYFISFHSQPPASAYLLLVNNFNCIPTYCLVTASSLHSLPFLVARCSVFGVDSNETAKNISRAERTDFPPPCFERHGETSLPKSHTATRPMFTFAAPPFGFISVVQLISHGPFCARFARPALVSKRPVPTAQAVI